MKRVHGHLAKGPDNYTETQWKALKKYWELSEYKEKLGKMSETRSKVVYNPRQGRLGYAGKEAQLMSLHYLIVFA